MGKVTAVPKTEMAYMFIINVLGTSTFALTRVELGSVIGLISREKN